MSVDDVFSPDYATARRRFLAAAERAGARVTSHVLPRERGLGGEELAMDVAWLGPAEPSAVLVISSGLHGVEGFVGSALQLELLASRAHVAAAAPSSGTAVVLIHAVNPYGFSHVDRSNEENVDLNRNFVDHATLRHENPGYVHLADAIAPATLDDDADAARLARLQAFATAHGLRRLEEAVSGGQYSHPRGLYYGGERTQWSTQRLLAIARDAASRARRVAWIDVHTGLGEPAALSLLSDLPADSPAFQRARRWYGAAAESLVGGDATSVVTHGSLDFGLYEALAPAAEATVITAELGTQPPFEVFLALRARNWLRHHGDTDLHAPRARAIREALTAAFDPRATRWREDALAAVRGAVARTIDGLEADLR